ncbi:DUF2878 domain-containing protein [Enterovibrio sp. ZSDZ35]|uniref:DUF2878 domain-containing protein n=1 Tax=Enterovibrio qingdaonensis TaxID=2899818 RepID=A0ABT5QG19_9GAMM|nr:DUF2878 domain-containing protein [Enterovibrio sp. ZSDZ35]MDD1779643.1 DUF2878 domain-containing protein [Enterovibrio sp. ZSDZ35]
MRFIVISVWFNMYWFAAVVGQHTALPFLILALIGALLVDRTVLFAILLFGLIGITGDYVLRHFDVLRFDTPFLPIWLCLLWAGFAVYIWLMREWLLAKPTWMLVLAGSVGGGVSYLAGERLGAVSFSFGVVSSFIILAVVWLGYTVTFISLLRWAANKEDKCITSKGT